jgi:type I restriction enzyme M protein
MADENKAQYNLPVGYDWVSMKGKEKGDLSEKYKDILKKLAESGGMLKKIFEGAQNKINDSAKLRRLINLIGDEDWTSKEVDIKGEIYESLLQKNAENSGAGQYFTPRAVIKAMVESIQPKVGEAIADPSCGTGGFFLGALEYLHKKLLSGADEKTISQKTFHGWEIEKSTARLCLMNLFLHGVGDLIDTPDIEVTDSLRVIPTAKVKIVLANPPFGKSSSDVPSNDEKYKDKEGYIYRPDFWVTTSNKQLAFLQHIISMLNEEGRAAIVLPDNVLFEGGVGETIRKRMLDELNLHTILRLPTGIFYAQGVKANVLFFEKIEGKGQPKTKEIWYYDYRTNIRHTPKKNPLRYEHLEDFVNCFYPENKNLRVETFHEKENPEGRWRKFTYENLISRDKTNLDITWLKDENLIDLENLPEPDVLIDEIIENIQSSLESFKTIKEYLD